MALYFARDFNGAAERFEAVCGADGLRPGDPPSRALAARARGYAKAPPPADWDGSLDIKKKHF
jgi:hypothetical protein